MYQDLKNIFEEHTDSEKAALMSKYLRNKFSFYGIQSKQRRECERQFLKEARKRKSISWADIDQIWESPQREMQYFVCDYLIRMEKFITFDDLSHIEKYVRSKQWWDTIDSLIKIYGKLSLRDSRVSNLMLEYSTDSDFWVRRLAIEHQLLLKNKVNTQVLERIILNNLDSEEFFINKAIGWALRDYSKTNPVWVQKFITENKMHMSSLSVKEGSKYLN